MEEAKRKIETCLQNEPAYCTVACPFQLNMRDFIEKMQRGAFNAAFKVYRNAVGFPEIVAELCPQPCRAVCPRAKTDAPISVKLLEKASIRYARNINPIDYNVPLKNNRIAIIGAGISGLACALRLATKKYDVTIYEKTDKIGGHLWEILPDDLFLTDIKRQFMHERYTLSLNTNITSLDELDYDAIYVATGKGGEDFGLLGSVKQGSFASSRPGVFLGGSILGVNSVEAVAHGLQVANPIERYIKTGSMAHPIKKNETKMHLDPTVLTPMPPVLPEDKTSYTREETKAEAQRCLRCACDACQRHCDLMTYYNRYPKRIRDEVKITLDPPILEGHGFVATRLIASCNQCGLCKDICPQGIDMGEFLLKSRQAMHKKQSMPWVFHDFWLRDMAFANSQVAQLSRLPNGYNKSSYMFFPGCQLGASDVQYVSKSYQWLISQKPDTALMLACCGAPALWSGDTELHADTIAKLKEDWISLGKPKAIFACPTCKQMFDRFLPEVEGVFLYDVMLEWRITPKKIVSEELASVFDPCSSRQEPKLQQAVRKLANKAGFKLQALKYEGKLAKCCSWGGHVSIANPTYAKEVVKKRISQNDNPYITYCVNCRDIFASAGKPCYHILDILFSLHDLEYKPPTITERRTNRRNLKREMLAKYWNEEIEMTQDESKIKLIIPPQLKQKLNDNMILETDIQAVVEHCENSGEKILNQDTGNFIGHLQIGYMTYWVEYRKTDDDFELINAYSHRMGIGEV